MEIREYSKSDEKEWLKCRLLSFYDCSYCDNIIHKKDEYAEKDINLVAVDNNEIIGFLDVEICNNSTDIKGIIWDLGVRSVNFEVSLDRKDELKKKFYRVHEVRLYELKLG